MQPLHRSRYKRTHLFRTERNDHVDFGERDVVQALGAVVRNVDVLLGKGAHGEGVQGARLGTGTQEGIALRRHRARKPLRHLAAPRVGDAKKQNRLQVPISSA